MNFFARPHPHKARLTTSYGDVCSCQLCARRCRIPNGERGWCRVRYNDSGILYTETYGIVTAMCLDPIEKKPLYHYLPGSETFSLSSYGCNFSCRHCQNHTLSQTHPSSSYDIPPEKIIRELRTTPAKSIAFTYNEPTLSFEYISEIAAAADRIGIKTVLITNGYLSEEALSELAPVLGAIRIDLKAFTDTFYQNICSARLQPVLETILRARELGLHTELVTLIIPGLNDSPEEISAMLAWETEHLGRYVPHHFTAFTPMYLMKDTPRTPVTTLGRIFRQAQVAGLAYPYLGNVSHQEGSTTFCPECGHVLILRSGYQTRVTGLSHGCCSHCGRPFDGIL